MKALDKLENIVERILPSTSSKYEKHSTVMLNICVVVKHYSDKDIIIKLLEKLFKQHVCSYAHIECELSNICIVDLKRSIRSIELIFNFDKTYDVVRICNSKNIEDVEYMLEIFNKIIERLEELSLKYVVEIKYENNIQITKK